MVKRTAKRTVKHTVGHRGENGNIRIPKTLITHRPVKTLPAYKCSFCGAVSQPRVNNPKVCPSCHRPHWIA